VRVTPPRPSLGTLQLARIGEHELRLNLPNTPASQDLRIDARSSDPLVLGVQAPSRLPAGDAATPLRPSVRIAVKMMPDFALFI